MPNLDGVIAVRQIIEPERALDKPKTSLLVRATTKLPKPGLETSGKSFAGHSSLARQPPSGVRAGMCFISQAAQSYDDFLGGFLHPDLGLLACG